MCSSNLEFSPDILNASSASDLSIGYFIHSNELGAYKYYS